MACGWRYAPRWGVPLSCFYPRTYAAALADQRDSANGPSARHHLRPQSAAECAALARAETSSRPSPSFSYSHA
jgi:hypothetical protein